MGSTVYDDFNPSRGSTVSQCKVDIIVNSFSCCTADGASHNLPGYSILAFLFSKFVFQIAKCFSFLFFSFGFLLFLLYFGFHILWVFYIDTVRKGTAYVTVCRMCTSCPIIVASLNI